MSSTIKPKLTALLKTILWVVLVQLLLLNLSAASYAYKFTHFRQGSPPVFDHANILARTWKLFVGPSFYRDDKEPVPSFPITQVPLKLNEDLSIDTWYAEVPDSRKCIIMFHGYSSNKSFLNAEAFRFRQWGYNVLMVDLRAHGKSQGTVTGFGYKETEEVRKAFDFARAQGNHYITLYGVSMGAVLVIKAVAQQVVAPDAIITDMPFGSLHDHLKARARVTGFASEPFAFFTTLWIGIESGFNGFSLNTSEYAKSVTCPVLLQWGEQDRYVTAKETASIYYHLASQNKKLVLYPEADHDSYLQSDPMLWEKEVGGFLKGLH
ncbi:MAG TPA: alpha/beta fold hydrolase [Flavisolibacter sp.]|nr:alpha/beta fold hydrolase [Flavisolibacter sp.]